MRMLKCSFFLLVLVSCVDFSVDKEEMTEAFRSKKFQPVSDFLTLDSSRIHYVYIENNRPNLAVFVHGSPGSWSAFIDFLKNDSLLEIYDVVSIDRPGYGLSNQGIPEINLARQAQLLAGVIALFDQGNKILVGHSLGGPVVARIAMDYPLQVNGMILVAPSIDPEEEKYEWYRAWIRTRVGGWLTPDDFWVSNEEIMPLKKELEKMLPLWQDIQIPTIVIQGTKDSLVPKENAEFARKMLSDSVVEIRYVEGANHFIPWSDPATIVFALMDFRSN